MPTRTRDGVRLAYVEAGSGGPPVLLVHGIGHDRTAMSPLFDHWKPQRRVVAVDLRGHGDSDAPAGEYRVETFADDLAWLITELGLHKPVVVVHSLGVIGLDLAYRYPNLLGGLVLIDAPFLVPAPALEALAPVTAGLESPAYRDVLRGAAYQIAKSPVDDEARFEALIQRMTALPQHVLVPTWKNVFAYEATKAVADCPGPLLVIESWFSFTDLTRLKELNPNAWVGRTVGAGHFSHIESPAQITAMVDRFIARAVMPKLAGGNGAGHTLFAVYCADVAPGCDRVLRGATVEDVLAQGAQHAIADHGWKEGDFTPERLAYFRTLVRDAG